MKSTLYLSQIRLINVKCFEDLTVQLGEMNPKVPWTLILGDNATGKTTFLKSIALGLCDETSASALLKESDEGYIRRGKRKAVISLILSNKDRPLDRYQIITRIEKVKDDSPERVRQETRPKREEFPWDDIFACGYGAGRGTSGTGDIAGYSQLDSVYNLFNYTSELQNPELVIWRHSDSEEHKEILLKVLANVTKTEKVSLGGKNNIFGLLFDGPWGNIMPFRDLPDGYKSTSLWVADLMGWAIDYNGEFVHPNNVQGIVFIDEIEQHLHPKWQKTIVSNLRDLFPMVQFIATSHSPLIASSFSRVGGARAKDILIHLGLERNNIVSKYEISALELRGLDLDQVLASSAFDYIIEADPEWKRILYRASDLEQIPRRSKAENKEYQLLLGLIRRQMFDGRTKVERKIQEDYLNELEEKVKSKRNVLE